MSKATFLNPYNVFLYVLGHNKQHVSSFNYGKIQTTGAVLVAISIPIFTAQLEKSRDATDAANVRASIAQATADYLSSDSSTPSTSYIYKIDGKGTDAKWSQTNSENMEIGGATVKAVAGAKQVSITLNEGGDPQVTLSAAEFNGTEGAQTN